MYIYISECDVIFLI